LHIREARRPGESRRLRSAQAIAAVRQAAYNLDQPDAEDGMNVLLTGRAGVPALAARIAPALRRTES